MARNRFFKMTPGVPVEVLFGKTLSTETTLTNFQANAAVGEYGLYTRAGAIVATGSAMTAAHRKEELVWVYKETADKVRSLSPMLAGGVSPKNTPYAAAVNQVSSTVNAGVGTVDTKQELVFKVIETTPGNANLPTWTYTAKLAGGETAAWTSIAADINATEDEEFFTAVGAAAGLTITGTDPNRHFRIAAVIEPTPAGPEDSGVYYNHTYTTAAFAGSGLLSHIVELQEWDNVYGKGITHNYPDVSMANAEDFGKPPTVAEIVTGTTTFDIVALTANRTEASPTPVEQHVRQSFIYICVPAGQGAAIETYYNS